MLRGSLWVVASCAALLPIGLAGAADEGVRVADPVVHANLAIYLVHGATAGGAVPLTLAEAVASGRVKVRETGSVNELTVENTGDDEVFVQAGDIVKGGQQDRVLSVDLLLPPHSRRVPIAAFCVESGRWSARGGEDAQQFSSATAAMPSQEAKLAMRAYVAAASTVSALPAGQLRSAFASDPPAADSFEPQTRIWDTVKKTQDQLERSVGAPVAAPASPSSLQLSLENEKLKAAQAAYIDVLQGAGESGNDVVGYVFAINGKIAGGDIYASNALFRKMWRKLLAANVTEAIGKNDAAAAAAPPSADSVKAFLATAESARQFERTLNANVRLAMRDADHTLYAETRRGDDSWVHKNYLAK